MKTGFAGVSVWSLSIRMLVVFWAGSMFLAWAALVGGWFIAENRLRDLEDQIVMDTKALTAAWELETEILAHRRDDLLWEATGLNHYRQRADEHLLMAEGIAGRLDPYVRTAEERRIGRQIQEHMEALRERFTFATRPSEARTRSTDELLVIVNRFKTQNENQMYESIQAATRLHTLVSDLIISLSLGTAALLLAGSFIVISRVVRPALALTAGASRFGQGDLSTRAPVMHEDELGSLARTFNNMADDIANREKDRLQFVAMVVHDLKNPALAIDMGTRMLRESWHGGQTMEAQEAASLLDDISQEAKRLRTIIRDLTDDIQVASGRFSVNKERVDLCMLVRRLIQSQAHAFADHRVVVENGQACAVLGDADRLERVVQNLVSNAVKYSAPNTQITVRIERKDSFTVLTVSDQGRGISAEDQKILFQPFGRGRSAERLAEGTGMGLYVVKQIIEAHGGQITVQSEPGRGTTFQIKLPLA